MSAATWTPPETWPLRCTRLVTGNTECGKPATAVLLATFPCGHIAEPPSPVGQANCMECTDCIAHFVARSSAPVRVELPCPVCGAVAPPLSRVTGIHQRPVNEGDLP